MRCISYAVPVRALRFESAYEPEIRNCSDRKSCLLYTSGTGLSRFQRMFPERFFDVGIAEEHAVTFAAGLAAGGIKPVFAVCLLYTSIRNIFAFLQD